MTTGELEWRLKRTESIHILLFKDLRDRCGGKQPPVSGCESNSSILQAGRVSFASLRGEPEYQAGRTLLVPQPT